MDFGLVDRVVLVTGSSTGIGKATALAFAREGAKVAITYHRQRDQAEEVARQVRESGGQSIVLPFDLLDPASISAAVQTVLKTWGRIDVLVNNAVQWGDIETIFNPGLFENFPFENWQKSLDANLSGVYRTIQAVLPAMRSQGWGRIVTLTSDAEFPGTAPYLTAKTGLHGLTRVLANEVGPAGIYSNLVMPGFTVTERNLEAMPDEVRRSAALMTPTRKLSVPADAANLIVFLGSAANGNINGQLILSNGGMK